MTNPETYSFQRYLEAKQTVDERALNRRVQERLQTELNGMASPLHVLEVGPGVGGTIERVVAWDALPGRIEYTAVDIDPDLIARARTRLLEQSEEDTFEVHEQGSTLVAHRGRREIVINLVTQDIFEFIEGTDQLWDLLISQAFLDLTNVNRALSTLRSAVRSGGLLYFPITFDGGTIFAPPVDPELDDRIERRYHHYLESADDDDDDGGDCHAGRRLLTALPAIGGEIITAGSSDWVVVPKADGYPADEAYFLHHIIQMIQGGLADDPTLDSDQFDEWVKIRNRQIENGRLVYIAHQLDVLGRNP